MPKFRLPKVKFANPEPEKRVGLAFMLIGLISLYVFLLYIWAGNPVDLPALAAIVVVIVLGWGLRKRFKPAPPKLRAPRANLKLPGLLRRKPKSAPAAEADEVEVPEPARPLPPKKQGRARLLRLPGLRK